MYRLTNMKYYSCLINAIKFLVLIQSKNEKNLMQNVGTAFENYDGASRGPEVAEEFSSNQNVTELSRISTWPTTIV